VNLSYSWSVEGEAYHCLINLPTRRRRRLERSIEALAAHPLRPSLFVDRTSAGERLDVVEFDGFLVTYHAEHSVRRIRIPELQPLP
jgi:hypothetical protein